MNKNSPPIIDGKELKKFLFARYTRIAQHGAIPCDTHERRKILDATDQGRYLCNVQVEAFDKDHAIERLTVELYPFVPKKDWEFVCDLDWDHDLGMMGAKHPFIPVGARKNLH